MMTFREAVHGTPFALEREILHHHQDGAYVEEIAQSLMVDTGTVVDVVKWALFAPRWKATPRDTGYRVGWFANPRRPNEYLPTHLVDADTLERVCDGVGETGRTTFEEVADFLYVSGVDCEHCLNRWHHAELTGE